MMMFTMMFMMKAAYPLENLGWSQLRTIITKDALSVSFVLLLDL